MNSFFITQFKQIKIPKLKIKKFEVTDVPKKNNKSKSKRAIW